MTTFSLTPKIVRPVLFLPPPPSKKFNQADLISSNKGSHDPCLENLRENPDRIVIISWHHMKNY